jgi:hypothetical protein
MVTLDHPQGIIRATIWPLTESPNACARTINAGFSFVKTEKKSWA